MIRHEKRRLNVTISEDVVSWIDEAIENHVFASRSQAFDYAVFQLMQDELDELEKYC